MSSGTAGYVADRIKLELLKLVGQVNTPAMQKQCKDVAMRQLHEMINEGVVETFPDLGSHVTVKQGVDPTVVDIDFSKELQEHIEQPYFGARALAKRSAEYRELQYSMTDAQAYDWAVEQGWSDERIEAMRQYRLTLLPL